MEFELSQPLATSSLVWTKKKTYYILLSLFRALDSFFLPVVTMSVSWVSVRGEGGGDLLKPSRAKRNLLPPDRNKVNDKLRQWCDISIWSTLWHGVKRQVDTIIVTVAKHAGSVFTIASMYTLVPLLSQSLIEYACSSSPAASGPRSTQTCYPLARNNIRGVV